MYKIILSFLLVVSLLLSLVACTAKDTATTIPTTEPTEPPTTESPQPTAHELYSQAVETLKSKDNVTMNFRSSEQHKVWNDLFLCSSEGKTVFEGLQGELLSKTVGKITFNHDTPISYIDIFVGGASYATFGQSKYQDKVSRDDYLERQYPICLFDADSFDTGEVTETPEGIRLTFSGATEPEEWVAPDYAELIEATAEMLIGKSGIESMTYAATYRQGAADITMSVTTDLTLDAESILSTEPPTDKNAYTPITYSFIPRMIARATSNSDVSKDRSGQILQIVSSQAAQAVAYRTTSVNISIVDGKPLVKNEYGGTLYTADGNTPYTGTAFYRDGVLTSTDSNGASASKTVDETVLRGWVNEEFSSYRPHLNWLSSVVVSNVGDGYLIEMEYYSDYAKEYMKRSTANEIGIDIDALDDLSSGYTTDAMTAYMGIDPDTWLMTSYGFYYQGTHIIKGGAYILSQQYYAKLSDADPYAYEFITDEAPAEEEPQVPATPLFYHVTGEDGSEMWLLGTIHLGDNRTAYLPQEIYDAFDASDALAVEFNSNAYVEEMATNEDYQESITDMYFYTDESTIRDHLTPEVYEVALKFLKYSGDYNPNLDYTKPFVWESAISQALTGSGRRLFSEKGVDQRLIDLAEERGKEILDVESAESQITILSEFSDGLQEALLASTLSSTRSEYNHNISKLYELWCSGDEAALIAYLRNNEAEEEGEEEEEIDEETQKLLEEYNKAISTERDIDMIVVATDYLRSGKVVFYAVGLAHLLAENGLVDGLRAAGYTVELVQFSGSKS